MHRRLALLTTAALLAAAPAAVAHHGWGSYEPTAAQTLSGTIERVQAAGPHVTLWLRAGDKTWEVVLAPPSRMANRGLRADSLRPGQAVEVHGYPHRADTDEMRAEWIRAGEGAQPVALR